MRMAAEVKCSNQLVSVLWIRLVVTLGHFPLSHLKYYQEGSYSEINRNQEILWQKWLLTIASTDNIAICDATLITLSRAFTTCECATQTDFVLPEFHKKTSSLYTLSTRRSVDERGYQTRSIDRFELHPKCTSNDLIAGFFSYNYAVAHASKPFERTDFTNPILLPILDFKIVNFTLWQFLGRTRNRCFVMGWKYNIPFRIPVAHAEGCDWKLCTHFGNTCPLNLEEKGLLCAKTDDDWSDLDWEGSTEEFEGGQKWADKSTINNICDGTILSGSPLVCLGFLMGLTAPGLCRLNVPIIVSRIEPALEFIHKEMKGESPAVTQPSYWVVILTAALVSAISTMYWPLESLGTK